MPRPPFALSITAALLPCAAALAQSAAPEAPPERRGFELSLGGGALVGPDYAGSKSYRAQVLPAIRGGYSDWLDFSVEDGIAVTALRAGGFTAGPLARIRFGHSESDNKKILRGLGTIDTAVELGGFVGYGIGPVGVKASVGQDVAGGHKGLVADFEATYTAAIFGSNAGPWLLSVGPKAMVTSARFTQANFGIDATQAARSGRARYQPKGGLESYGVGAVMIAPISERVALTGLVGWDRLAGDAANSPLVRNGVGSVNQVSGGLFLTYKLY